MVRQPPLKDFMTAVLIFAETGLTEKQYIAFRAKTLNYYRTAEPKLEAVGLEWFKDKILLLGNTSAFGASQDRYAGFKDAVMDEYKRATGEEE